MSDTYSYWCDEHFPSNIPEFAIDPFAAVCDVCGKRATHWFDKIAPDVAADVPQEGKVNDGQLED